MESELTPDEFDTFVNEDGAQYILGITSAKLREYVKLGLAVGKNRPCTHDNILEQPLIYIGCAYFKIGELVGYVYNDLPQEEKTAVVRRAKLASKIDSGYVIEVSGDGKERTLRRYVKVDGQEEPGSLTTSKNGEDAPAAEEAGPEKRMPSPAEMKEMRKREPKVWTVRALGNEFFSHRGTPGSMRSAVYEYLGRADRPQKHGKQTRGQGKDK